MSDTHSARVVVDLTGGAIHGVAASHDTQVVFFDTDLENTLAGDLKMLLPDGRQATYWRWESERNLHHDISVDAIFALTGAPAQEIQDTSHVDTVEDLVDLCDLTPESLAEDVEVFLKQQRQWAAFVRHTLAAHGEEDEAIAMPSPQRLQSAVTDEAADGMGQNTKVVYDLVLGAMQNADELGGPERDQYIVLMNAIADEAHKRAATASSIAG